jgi:hypothetical protein
VDPPANVNFVHGRPTQNDETLFAFASYAEHNHDGTLLRDQVGRLVEMVVSPTLIDRLAEAHYVTRLRVRRSGYLPRRQRLHDFACEWQRLEVLSNSGAAQASTRSGRSRCGHRSGRY